MQIVLPDEFAAEDAAVVLKYLHGEPLAPEQRSRVLTAFDLLHLARVIDSGITQTFKVVYRDLVDRRYCDGFVDELYAPDGLRAAPTRQAAVARAIQRTLRDCDWLPVGVPESRLLAAYCLYWWSAFARGCAFEVEVFRDLSYSGIEFHPHDLRRRDERFSSADLVVLEFLGDVKSSTYFLDAARTRSLSLDFYVTQSRTGTRPRRWLVFLQRAMWERLDGPTERCSIAELPDVLPRPACVSHGSVELVVADYEVWKDRLRKAQTARQEQAHE
jgi:hypothetical protein